MVDFNKLSYYAITVDYAARRDCRAGDRCALVAKHSFGYRVKEIIFLVVAIRHLGAQHHDRWMLCGYHGQGCPTSPP
jgi:hypothetical protein